MPVILLLIAAVLIVAAYRNTQTQLGGLLAQDLPGFGVWLVAIGLLGGLGYIPGLSSLSRWLIALVILAAFLSRYRAVLAGFSALRTPAAPSTPPASPAAAYGAAVGAGSSSGAP